MSMAYIRTLQFKGCSPQLRNRGPIRLSDEDQQALVVLIDSLVKRSEFQRVMAG
jgi:hypothetical protein